MNPVALSLGTNMGERERLMKAMEAAVGSLLSGSVRVSPLMETEALDVSSGGPAFLNRIISGEYDGSARQLLRDCQAIENQLGRERLYRGAPRTSDIDILLFGSEIIELPDLLIPHPAIVHRRFCLEGLADVVPETILPGGEETFAELRERMSADIAGQVVRFCRERESS